MAMRKLWGRKMLQQTLHRWQWRIDELLRRRLLLCVRRML